MLPCLYKLLTLSGWILPGQSGYPRIFTQTRVPDSYIIIKNSKPLKQVSFSSHGNGTKYLNNFMDQFCTWTQNLYFFVVFQREIGFRQFLAQALRLEHLWGPSAAAGQARWPSDAARGPSPALCSYLFKIFHMICLHPIDTRGGAGSKKRSLGNYLTNKLRYTFSR